MNGKLSIPMILTVGIFVTVCFFQQGYSNYGKTSGPVPTALDATKASPGPIVLLKRKSASELVETQMTQWDKNYRMLSRAAVRRTTEFVKVEFSDALETEAHFFLGTVTLRQNEAEKKIPVAVDRLSKKIFIMTASQWMAGERVSLDQLFR